MQVLFGRIITQNVISEDKAISNEKELNTSIAMVLDIILYLTLLISLCSLHNVFM